MRNWQNVRALACAGPVAVIAAGRPTGRPTDPRIVAWEAPADLAPGQAPAAPADLLAWLRHGGHPSDSWFSPTVAAALAQLVERVGARVVVVGHLWLHTYIPALRELGCRVVLDAHNLEGPLHAELARGRPDLVRTRFAAAAFEIEEATFASVDQIWVCSRDDARHVRERYPSSAPAVVVPNTVDAGRYEIAALPGGAPLLVFPGAFAYPPNVDAVRWLLDEIFPAVADARPDARLLLVGSGETAEMEAAAGRDPRIRVTGAVDDTAPFLSEATVVPVPLRAGGGTRFKVLEALASGVPVVSTAKGVEGLELVAGDEYVRAETTDEFVRAVLATADEAALRTRLASRGLAAVRERFSFASARDAVQEALDELSARAS
jgi:polysaccharide biosynthesis protein PslH